MSPDDIHRHNAKVILNHTIALFDQNRVSVNAAIEEIENVYETLVARKFGKAFLMERLKERVKTVEKWMSCECPDCQVLNMEQAMREAASAGKPN